MKYLLIDTSTNALIIMLYDNQVKLDEHIRFGKQDHQAHIVPMIEHMLQTHNLKVQDLSGIIVGVGPGSYTGLRVGVMTAKMLSYATNVKLYKVSSLVFLSSGYQQKALIWHDARNDQGFSATIEKGIILDEEKVRHLDELSDEEKEILILLSPDTIKLDGTVVIDKKEEVEDIFSLIPNYLRQTEAEKNLDKNRSHS